MGGVPLADVGWGDVSGWELPVKPPDPFQSHWTLYKHTILILLFLERGWAALLLGLILAIVCRNIVISLDIQVAAHRSQVPLQAIGFENGLTVEHFGRLVEAWLGQGRFPVLACLGRLARLGVRHQVRGSGLLTLLKQTRMINYFGHLLVLLECHLIGAPILPALNHLRWLDKALLQLLLAHL